MNGLMKYPVAESTGVAHENIDAMLDQNLAEHMIDRYETHGTIGPQPDYAVKPGKGIFGQPTAGMTHDALMEYASGLAMGTAGGGPANLGKGMLKYLTKFVKTPPKTMQEFRRMANVNPGGYARIKGRVKQYLETNKPYQQARQKFKEWDQPPLLESDPIIAAAGRSGRHTIDDIAGKRGLDRLFHTIGRKDSPMNNPRVRAAIEETIGSRIRQADILPVPKTYNIKEFLKGPKGQRIGGRAWTDWSPNARVEFGRSKDLDWLDSVGKHEFTHVAQLQGPRNAKWMDYMAKKHKLTGDEMSWMQSNIYDRSSRPFWDSSKNPNMTSRKQWEEDYFEKIYPHLKPKVKEWYDKYSTGKTHPKNLIKKDKTNEYHLRPKEMSARASQIRHEIDKMNAGDTAQKKAGSLLERLVSREGRILTDEGLDMIVNKLWGVGPVGLGLSFQEGKAKK